MTDRRQSLDERSASLLTPEEQAAIDSNPDKDQEDALRSILAAGGADEGEGDGDEDVGKGADAGDKEGGEKAAEAKHADPADVATDRQAARGDASAVVPAAQGAAEVDDEPALRVHQSKIPDDYDERVKTNKDAIAALRKQRDDGEVSMTEYDAQFDRLNDERDELRAERLRHEAVAQVRADEDAALRLKHQERIIAEASKSGLDYTKDQTLVDDFNLFFGPLHARAEREGKSMRWVYDEAHRRVALLRGVEQPSTKVDPKPAAAAQADPKKAVADARKPDLSSAATSLANVPGTNGPGDVSEDEYDDIDRLDGLELEAALAAQQKRDPNFAAKYTAKLRGNAPSRSRSVPH